MKLDLEINKGFKLHYASEREKPACQFRASSIQPEWHLYNEAWPFLHLSLSCKVLLRHIEAFVSAAESRDNDP